MRYRVVFPDYVVEADSVEDVRALVASRTDLAPPSKSVATVRHRGASSGALDGRILAALKEHGAMKPSALVADVKSSPYAVLKAVKQLAASGALRVEGRTANRTISLAKGGR